MAKRSRSGDDRDLADIVRTIVRDSGRLLDKQVDLFRVEISQQFRRGAGSALLMAAASGFAAVSGLMASLMLVHLLHRGTRLPLWCCYGAVGAASGAASAAFLRAGRDGLANLRLPPPQSAAAAEENLAWLKEQVKPAAT